MYASVFNNKDLYNDVILPGSIGNIAPEDILLIYERNPEEVIGYIAFIEEGGYGLLVEGVTTNKDVLHQIKTGKIRGMSMYLSALQRCIDSISKTRYMGGLGFMKSAL